MHGRPDRRRPTPSSAEAAVTGRGGDRAGRWRAGAGEGPSRLLCLCAPAGQDEFFTLVGQPVATRTSPPPPLDPTAQAAFVASVQTLAPQYRTELLPPPGSNP